MNQERVRATYLVETPYSLECAAATIAGEQSTGTFTSVPGETDELKAKFGAIVEHIEELGEADTPSLPGAKPPAGHDGKYRQGRVTVSFPLHNFGPSIPNLLSAVVGNLYELQELSGLRLLDLDLPQSFTTRYPGPKFGIAGTRKLTGVYDRPILGTIIKPSIGLSTEQLSELVKKLALAGFQRETCSRGRSTVGFYGSLPKAQFMLPISQMPAEHLCSTSIRWNGIRKCVTSLESR